MSTQSILVLFGPSVHIGSIRSILYTSVWLSPLRSNSAHSSHFGSIRSILFTLVLFGPLQFYLVHFGPIMSNSILFCLLWSICVHFGPFNPFLCTYIMEKASFGWKLRLWVWIWVLIMFGWSVGWNCLRHCQRLLLSPEIKDKSKATGGGRPKILRW